LPEPRRILLLIGQLSQGGAERQVINLAKAVDRRRFQVQLAVLSGLLQLAPEARAAGIPLQVIEKRGRFDLRPALHVARLVRRERIQLLQTYLYSANVIGMAAALLCRVPLVISERSAPPRLGMEKRVVYGLGQLAAQAVMVNGASVARLLSQAAGIRSRKIAIIRNGIEMAAFAARPRCYESGTEAGRRFTVGTVGRMVPVKNYELLIEAMAGLRAAGVGAQLEIVGGEEAGSGYGDRLRALCAQLQLKGGVRFAGARDDVPRLLRGFDVFVQASHWEGTSNALLEAMAAGLPAVVSEAGDSGRIVGDAGCGYVVQRTPRAFAAALARLAGDAELRANLGKRAAAYAARHFSLQRLAAETEALWTRILECN
jgi:glycosyltransferase involved in cell wall biosynthesis